MELILGFTTALLISIALTPLFMRFAGPLKLVDMPDEERHIHDYAIPRVGGLGMLGLSLPRLLQAAERPRGLKPRAKRVIFLFMAGAPSQLDLFDHKPGLQEYFDKELPASVRNNQRITTMTSGQAISPPTIPLAIIIPALFGILLAGPIVHLRGDYLLVVTIGFNIVFVQVLQNNLGGVTGGPNGIFGLDSLSLFGTELMSQRSSCRQYVSWVMSSRGMSACICQIQES